MTFATALRQLGWTQSAYAQFMDRNPRSVRRWCSGESPAPSESEALLLVMLAYGISVEDLERLMREETE